MSIRTIKGERLHHTGKLLGYDIQYEFKPIGIVYKADVALEGKSTKLVQGVITWSLRAFPPGRRVEESIWEDIEFLDMDKLVARLHEA